MCMKRKRNDFQKIITRALRSENMIVGIDEVGRGPVAGPVAVCAVWYKAQDHKEIETYFEGMNDSKKVHVNKRRLFAKTAQELQDKGLINYTIQYGSAEKIDQEGISACLKSGIERSLKIAAKDGLVSTDYIFLDGSLRAPDTYYKQKTIIGGDGKVFAISLASVIAKVARDEIMEEYGITYPQYGFEQHKGYGTVAHIKAIKEHGACALHRKTWLTKYL